MKALLAHLASAFLYYTGFIRLLRFLGRHNAKILLYHSVSEDKGLAGGPGNCVPPSLFFKHMDYVVKHYRIVSLDQLVEALERGTLPSRAAVITFDDGFADNFHHAYPFFKERMIPATIFLAMKPLTSGKPLWVQELHYLTGRFGSRSVAEKLGTIAGNREITPSAGQHGAEITTLKALEGYLAYSVNKDRRDEILDVLYREFAVLREGALSGQKPYLDWDQVQQMHADGISFGNHGMSHTSFASMPLDEQEKEIRDSKKSMDQHLPMAFIPFSYPFGQARDFTPETESLVKRAGHHCILTAMPTLNGPGTTPYRLGRIPLGSIPVFRLAFELEKGVLKKLLRRETAKPACTRST